MLCLYEKLIFYLQNILSEKKLSFLEVMPPLWQMKKELTQTQKELAKVKAQTQRKLSRIQKELGKLKASQ